MAESSGAAGASQAPKREDVLLFWACFIALIATAFGFVVRSFLINEWGTTFNLTEVQKGQILGVGLWPFAISIILFSLIIDRIGYGVAMIFAFVCHVASAVLTITATGYEQLYWATFIVALANGTVEAVINPVVATLFPREKTKWLNRLHAGWPGGLVLGGILAIVMGNADWRLKVGLILLPTVLYGILMIGREFPIQERVAAGVSYRDMLREFGMVGAFIVAFFIVAELARAFGLQASVGLAPHVLGLIAAVPIALAFGAPIGFAPGRPLFLFLMLVMIPLATTELGTDSWITDLMGPQMAAFGLNAGWVLVYTSAIMMILRFCAGPIVHRLSPLGLLAVSSLVACLGLLFLSRSQGAAILAAATLYGLGKSFFWPTMLGVVSEQFPRGGALTLNAIAGVGMLAVGVIGTQFIGYIQDTSVNAHLQQQQPGIYQQLAAEKSWLFGSYPTVDPERVKALPEAQRMAVDEISNEAKKQALTSVAALPAIMLVCYLALLAYFRARGGYKAEILAEAHGPHPPEKDVQFTGGVEGPVEA